MPSSTSTRRPGIVFQTVPPPPPDTLPRMDIAGFVGFASQGPVNVPVPVEDATRFADVFGPPLDLVQDPETGRMQQSHLAAAVTAFFANGGRRCWVVRVADDPAQRWFVVPGLVNARTGTPAVARARSLGSGFDDLRVSTVLRRQTAPGAVLRRTGSMWTLEWTVAPDGIEAGTLLRVVFPGDSERDDVDLYLTVADLQETGTPDDGSASSRGPTGVVASIGEVFAYQRNPALSSDAEGPATVHRIDGAAALPDAADSSVSASYSAVLTRSGRGLVVQFDEVVPLPETGEVLRAEIDDEELDDDHVWLRVDVAGIEESDSSAAEPSTRIEASVHQWPVDPGGVVADGAVLRNGFLVETVTFDLLTWRGDDVQRRLSNLHLTARGSRSWLRLPTDDALFAVEDGAAVSPEPGTLAAEVFDARFGLAGPPPSGASDPEPVFVPFAMPNRPDPSMARGPVPVEAPALERDGLGTFDNTLFLDPALTDATTTSLRRRASDRLLLHDAPTRGVHALWPIREVTLLAVPDAVHRGWTEASVEDGPASVPAPDGLTATLCPNDETLLCIDWTPIALPSGSPPDSEESTRVRYELQESPVPPFDVRTLRHEGEDVHVERPITESCPQRLYFRVRAVTDAGRSPWSATAVAVVPPSDFRPARADLSVPTLRIEAVSGTSNPVIRWDRVPQDPSTGAPTGSPPEPPPVVYDLQRAADPAFDTAEAVAASEIRVVGARTLEHVPSRGPDPRFFRVRARRTTGGRPGPWSNTVVLDPVPDPPLAPVPPGEYDAPSTSPPNRGRDGLLDLQRAVLRFCAARGDVVAVLALPEHDRQPEAQDHRARLARRGAPVSADAVGPLDILPLGVDEDRTLSFGALYHPWPSVVVADGRTRAHPSGGEVCGMMAAHALRRGAWIAPANVPLQGVIGLHPSLSASPTDALLDAGVNVLALGPRGVTSQAADTLAPDDALAPIGTRRLLILLRRLAERAGPTLVFESNTPALRRRAARLFERVLADLFRRGALAGTTARDAYRVIADASVNPPERVERGHLVVEVKVAPARPLEFIVVRLVQRGAQTDVAEVR